MASSTSRNTELIPAFIREVQQFCETVPLAGNSPAAYPALKFHSSKLYGIIATLGQVRIKSFTTERNTMLLKGIKHLAQLNGLLYKNSLAGLTASFGEISEMTLAGQLKNLPEEKLVLLYNSLIMDPVELTEFDLITQVALLEEFGLSLNEIGKGVVVLFKLVVILILFLMILSNPLLVPLAMAVIKALADIDKAGKDGEDQAAGSGNAQGPIIKPGADGTTIITLPDGTVIVNNPGGPVITTPPGGKPVIEWPPQPGTTPPPRPGNSILQTIHLVHCEWHRIYPWDTGDYHNWEIIFSSAAGSGGTDIVLEIECDGEINTIRPGDRVSVTAKRCRIHLKGSPGDRGVAQVRGENF